MLYDVVLICHQKVLLFWNFAFRDSDDIYANEFRKEGWGKILPASIIIYIKQRRLLQTVSLGGQQFPILGLCLLLLSLAS